MTRQYPFVRSLRKLVPLVVFFLLGGTVGQRCWGQTPTPGLIFKSATVGTPGAAVLDPNGDGYVSATSAGFTAAAGDIGAQSEIPYKYLPQRTAMEPNADLRVGPGNKFTDFADVAGGGTTVGFYVDANNNYLFRFRLGASAPNSKGYSISIDTDNKFGFSGPNADPNAVAHNPGFEMEILLASNFGVRLYNIDGTTSPAGTAADGSLIELPYDSYAQKAVAVTTNDGTLDVFYDFYVPLATIQSAFGSQSFFNSTGTTAVPFSLTTSLRLVANTIIAPHSVTQYQNISDIGGVNDVSYAEPDNAFTDLISNTTPTTGATVAATAGSAIPARSAAPTAAAPLLSGATSVSGTSVEAAGTAITVYVNGTAVGTTTVLAGGAWTLTGLTALASGALVKATAAAPNKSGSDFSNAVQVGTALACATAMPGITCASDRGLVGAAAPGATVYLRYPNGALVGLTDGAKALAGNPVVASGTGFFIFTTPGGGTNCTTGQPNALKGTYLISQTATGTSCESAGALVCINALPTATPVVTTPRPITPGTLSIAGTATSGASVTLSVDGNRFSTVPATGTGGAYVFTGATLPALTSGRVLTISAITNATSCVSAAVTLNVVTARTVVPPVVGSPLFAGGTTVRGTSVEAVGSLISLTTYASNNGTGTATGTYSATVQADGSWTVTVAALGAASSVKATVTPADYSTSGFSNVVTVLTRTSAAPVITSLTFGTAVNNTSYTQGGTAVSGTSALIGATIALYLDGGDAIGTATVQANGQWTVSGLSSSLPTLYSGGTLTATATTTGQAPSALSNAVTVGCPTLASNALTGTAICQNSSATFTVATTEAGVVYTLQSAGTSTSVASSKAGTGSALTFTTPAYATAGPYSLQLSTFSVGAVNCEQTSGAVTLTVNELPLARTVSARNPTLSPSQAALTGTDIIVQSAQTDVSYQLINTSATPNADVGAPQAGTGADLNLPTGPVVTTATSTSYAVRGTNSSTGCTQLVGTQSITYADPLPVELTDFGVLAASGDAALTWHTASEKNNDRFEVERSITGVDFTRVGQVAGHGNSSQPQAYAYRDAAAMRLGTMVYYRLRQVDVNGSTSYSPVRVAIFERSKLSAQVLLYPNPASATVMCSLALLPPGTYAISVHNLIGQQLAAFTVAGGQERELDLVGLSAGVYLVQVQGAGTNLTQRFAKLR